MKVDINEKYPPNEEEVEILQKLLKDIQSYQKDSQYRSPTPTYDLQSRLNEISARPLSFKVSEIKKLSDLELSRLLTGELFGDQLTDATIQLINSELIVRQIEKPSIHSWVDYTTIVLALIAAITGTIQLIK
ncbi:hypothetical protein [Acinetobacter equi]|uniref:Uncharacterized protein n=1 Tax=Acinetobacter equi TaxID=1324350 RepID=A0A0N9VQM9_9GAMM|nr:hypothetical protein [Acinetobacter equi]ALH95687.1 hypothetical protein AOY20_09165 [Acinetobacter equi]